MKKVRGQIHYFGNWARREDGALVRVPGDGWEQALAEYRAVADDLHAGRTPRVAGGELTVAQLCSSFLMAKVRRVEAGEMTTSMLADYKTVTDLIVAVFGGRRRVDDLAADDFGHLRAAMARRWGPHRMRNTITRTRSVFRYGLDNGLYERPVRYGTEFRVPDKAVMRRHKAKGVANQMMEPTELRRLLDAADVPLRAMILLGLNCGFGAADVAALEHGHLNLGGGWVNFPRVKTGIERRCPLWPETVRAIRDVLAVRPEPADPAHAMLVFLTRDGTPVLRPAGGTSRTDNVWPRFAALLKRTGLDRPGRGPYTLRRVFRTVADEARDPVAIDLIMGHSDSSMGAVYRQRIDDARLVAVAGHVRKWLLLSVAQRSEVST